VTVITETLEKRGAEYGDYSELSGTAQVLKQFMREQKGWKKLTPSQRESLDLITTKMARILCGNPNNKDSWVDIAGYAELGGGWENGEAQVRSA